MFQLQAELRCPQWCGPGATVESMSNIPIMVVRINKASDPKLGGTSRNMAASVCLT